MEQKCYHSGKSISKIHGKKIELALETLLEIINNLGHKIEQPSLLRHPNCIIFKGLR